MQTRSAIQSRDVPQPDNRIDTLIFNEECATIVVSRRDLENELSVLMARVQQLRRILGLAPLKTAKQVRREQYG